MAAAVRLREDYDGVGLRELAKRSVDAAQTRRLFALAAIYDGGSRTEAAKIGGIGLSQMRDGWLAFNAEGPPGLVDGKAPGNAPLLTQAHRQALLQIVESGPIPAGHGVVRWRLIDLAQWVFEEFRILISKQTLSRELRALELRKLSARPRHHARTPRPWRRSKKLRCEPRRARPARGGGQADRDLVPGRGPDRSEERDHPALGAARHAALGTAPSADPVDLTLRRHLPGSRNRGRPHPAALQHRRDGAASGRDLPNGDAGSPRRAAARPGRMAPLR